MPKWSQNDPKVTRSDPDSTQKWSKIIRKNHPKLVLFWSKNGPDWPYIAPDRTKNGSKGAWCIRCPDLVNYVNHVNDVNDVNENKGNWTYWRREKATHRRMYFGMYILTTFCRSKGKFFLQTSPLTLCTCSLFFSGHLEMFRYVFRYVVAVNTCTSRIVHTKLKWCGILGFCSLFHLVGT